MAKPGHLERGHVRLAIIRALAAGATQGEMARKYEVSAQAMSLFVRRHADAIDAQRSKLDDEFAALWVASKANRLAEYQAQIDYVAAVLEDDEDDPDQPAEDGARAPRKAGVNVSTAELLRTAQTALKAVADELGQIPARMQVEHSGRVEVVLNGVDTAALR